MEDWASGGDWASGSGSGGDPAGQAELSRLQEMVAAEQQKAQFQLQVHTFTDVCWEKCVDRLTARLDSRTEGCLVSCVDRFVDTTLAITNRFGQMIQKGGH
uniref:Mitochondrial import inner membrane translocase subunit n=1 Tax=Callorhinchus milii TaxID=7868 RepID=V9LHG0_CALMI